MAPRIRRNRRKSNYDHGDNSNQEIVLEETGASSHGCEAVSGGKGKRTRGPTLLLKIWCREDDKPLIKVEFNEQGQPIGRNAGKFTEFLGVLSRNGKYAPIDICDWRKMPDNKRSKMIETIKERFELPPGSESWALTSIGKKWRNWKARIKAKYYNPSLTVEQMSSKIPRQIIEGQWENLMSHWNLEKAKDISARNKINRGKKTMNHTTGKLSFAVVRDEMEKEYGQAPCRVELFDHCYTDENGDPVNDDVGEKLAKMKDHQSRLPEGSADPIGENDSFAKVMGKDPPGLVRMYGLGVSPADAWGKIPSRTTCHRISKENELAMSKMEDKVNEQSTKLDEQAKQLAMQAAEMAELKAMVLHQRQTNDKNHSLDSDGFTQRQRNSIKVGSKVFIRSPKNFQKNVAEGTLVSLNPSKDVGGTLLGENWCEVHIWMPIEWAEPLLRTYSWFKTIGHTIGVAIAWPCHLIMIVEF